MPLAAVVALSLVAAALIFLVISPHEVALRWITDNYPVIAIANILLGLASALVTSAAYRAAKSTLELRWMLNVLELARTAGGFGIWQWNPKAGCGAPRRGAA